MEEEGVEPVYKVNRLGVHARRGVMPLGFVLNGHDGYPQTPYGRYRMAHSNEYRVTHEIFDPQEARELAGRNKDDELPNERKYTLKMLPDEQCPTNLFFATNLYRMTSADRKQWRADNCPNFPNDIKPCGDTCPKCHGLYVWDSLIGHCLCCGYVWNPVYRLAILEVRMAYQVVRV